MVKKKTGKKSKFDRSALKDRLLKRTEESYASKESSGKYGDIFKKDVKLPLWKPKDGEHLFNVIPYIVGNKDPKLSPGEVSYILDIWVHRNIGINEDSFVCPARNYGQACPICERQKEMRLSGTFSDDEIKDLNPKRRAVYNVQVCDTAEEEAKGIQIWEVSHFMTERLFSELSRKPKGGGFIPFSDPDNGKMLAFNKKSNMEYVGHKMVDRDEPISDSLLEEAYTLDELIYIPSYEELYAAFYGEDYAEEVEEEEEEVKEKPKKKAEKKKSEPTSELDEEEEELDSDPDSDEDEIEITEEDIQAMKPKELKAFVKEQELDLDPKDYKNVKEFKEAVWEALQEDSDEDWEETDPDEDDWEDDEESDLTDNSSDDTDWEDDEDEEPITSPKTRKKR